MNRNFSKVEIEAIKQIVVSVRKIREIIQPEYDDPVDNFLNQIVTNCQWLFGDVASDEEKLCSHLESLRKSKS